MHTHRSHGFTLLELLAVLAVIALITVLALPALGEGLARHRLRASADALLDAVTQARATAVRRDHETRMCPSIDGHICSPQADWARGWIGRDESLGTVFESMGPLDAKLAVVRRERRQTVDFARNGTTHGSNQTITLCVRGRPATALSITIANSGLAHRRRAEADQAAACAATSSRKR